MIWSLREGENRHSWAVLSCVMMDEDDTTARIKISHEHPTSSCFQHESVNFSEVDPCEAAFVSLL